MAARTAGAGRLVAVLALLAGLLGMHGLSDGVAPVSAHNGMGVPSGHRQMPGVVIDSAATPAQQPAATAVATAALSGCGMDHAGCVAVLRVVGHPDPPAAASALAAPPAATVPAHGAGGSTAQGSRGPPPVSLIGLGISRT